MPLYAFVHIYICRIEKSRARPWWSAYTVNQSTMCDDVVTCCHDDVTNFGALWRHGDVVWMVASSRDDDFSHHSCRRRRRETTTREAGQFSRLTRHLRLSYLKRRRGKMEERNAGPAWFGNQFRRSFLRCLEKVLLRYRTHSAPTLRNLCFRLYKVLSRFCLCS